MHGLKVLFIAVLAVGLVAGCSSDKDESADRGGSGDRSIPDAAPAPATASAPSLEAMRALLPAELAGYEVSDDGSGDVARGISATVSRTFTAASHATINVMIQCERGGRGPTRQASRLAEGGATAFEYKGHKGFEKAGLAGQVFLFAGECMVLVTGAGVEVGELKAVLDRLNVEAIAAL